MKVLVTGATGFVGQEVLRRLHAAGHTARILLRRPGSPDAQELARRFGVTVGAGNALEAASLGAAMTGMDAVIHLVGIISEIGEQTFENVHTRATQNVVSAAVASGVRRMIHMSALGARANAASRYHQTKWAAEECVQASGLDWTIFRPSLIYGPQDHFVNLFARMAKFSPVLPVMGPGTARLQPVAVEDVAACLVKAMTEPRSVGQTLDLCGPERLTLPEILQAILAATGRRRRIVRVPLGLARFPARLLEVVYPALLRRASPLNRDQLIMLQEDNVGNPEPAARLFNLRAQKFSDGIRRNLGRAT